MTREERLKQCKTCEERKLDVSKGIICKITNDIARFEGICPNYETAVELKSLENFKKEKAASKAYEAQRQVFTNQHDYHRHEHGSDSNSYENAQTQNFRTSKIPEPPEKITRDDIYLLLAVILPMFLIKRVSYYSENYSDNSNLAFNYLFILLCSGFLCLLLRKKDIKRYKVFGDIKFKLVFSGIFTGLNSLYSLVVFQQYAELVFMTVTMMVMAFILSIFSTIFVIPVNKLILLLKRS